MCCFFILHILSIFWIWPIFITLILWFIIGQKCWYSTYKQIKRYWKDIYMNRSCWRIPKPYGIESEINKHSWKRQIKLAPHYYRLLPPKPVNQPFLSCFWFRLESGVWWSQSGFAQVANDCCAWATAPFHLECPGKETKQKLIDFCVDELKCWILNDAFCYQRTQGLKKHNNSPI